MSDAAAAPQEPHFAGHRERLRERFRRGGSSALNDYKFLELILFRAMPRRDVKPIAKALLAPSVNLSGAPGTQQDAARARRIVHFPVARVA